MPHIKGSIHLYYKWFPAHPTDKFIHGWQSSKITMMMGKCYPTILHKKTFLLQYPFLFLFHSFITGRQHGFFVCFHESLNHFWGLKISLTVHFVCSHFPNKAVRTHWKTLFLSSLFCAVTITIERKCIHMLAALVTPPSKKVSFWVFLMLFQELILCVLYFIQKQTILLLFQTYMYSCHKMTPSIKLKITWQVGASLPESEFD